MAPPQGFYKQLYCKDTIRLESGGGGGGGPVTRVFAISPVPMHSTYSLLSLISVQEQRGHPHQDRRCLPSCLQPSIPGCLRFYHFLPP